MKQLRVQGRGHVTAEPDIVIISFSVSGRAMDYEAALKNLHNRVNNLRENLSASGLDKSDLKTTDFNVAVETDYKDGRSIFRGYRANHRLIIELPIQRELLNSVLANIGEGYSGAQIKLDFSVKDKEALREKVLILAVKNARKNAEILASAAGVKLGEIKEVNYHWSEVRFYHRKAEMICESASEYSADIEPEEISASDNVTIIYEIADQ